MNDREIAGMERCKERRRVRENMDRWKYIKKEEKIRKAMVAQRKNEDDRENIAILRRLIAEGKSPDPKDLERYNLRMDD